ncbi:hypothetical protein UFOVP821_38 [uncultured Caudovirales phage]|uniref:Uncharacterized protein n=1 Tax=uncultured Caudovirales phage TaxID=2100421 RepID=A0A6J5P216_9CAUD|nr:hypothetical protein UFOVP821_38 [uncultured Caudovirales phage]
MPIAHTTTATGTNDATKQVSVTAWNAAHTISEYVDIPVPTSTPAAPSTGSRVYTSSHAGKAFLTWKGPADVETMVQPHIGEMAAIYRVITGTAAAAGTVMTGIGMGFTSTASTYAFSTPTTGSVLGSLRRYVLTSTATAGNQISNRGNVLMASSVTGYMFMTTAHLNALGTANLGFFGLMDTTSAISTAVNYTTTTVQNKIGIGFALNTGNWKLIYGPAGSAPTSTDLGASFPINTTDLLRLSLFCERDTTTVFYLVENLTSGATASGSITTGLPAAATLLGPYQYMSNNAANTAVGFSSVGWSLEQYI